MSPVEGELRAHPFPSALVGARQAGRAGWLDELLAWRPDAALDLDELAERYDGSQALLRFLLAREPGSAWLDRLWAVQARSAEHIAALEPEWLAWLVGLDALAVIGERTRTGAERERARAAALLPILAERGAPELATRAADELALDLLADPACRAAAATFLLFFRAAALDPVDLARLESSDDASQVLTAQALRARRRETPDMDAARSAWSRLTELERISCATEAALLPGLVEGR